MDERMPAVRSGIDRDRTDLADAKLLDRFVTSRDEAAFAAMLSRHGPMVFGVCRRALHQAQDAEDAFQATFLVLVRKAATIGRRHLLSNWLYGVATRVASRVRLKEAKRRRREQAGLDCVNGAICLPTQSSDLSVALVGEVERLPAKYRGLIIMCYLEGRTNEEAAGELGFPVGTIKTRLFRGREMLRKRLSQRGVALPSAAAFSAALSPDTLTALPPTLIDSTLKASTSFAAGNAPANGVVSTQAAALTKEVLHSMFVTKMKTLAAIVLALAALVGGTAVFAFHNQVKEADAKEQSKPDNEAIQGKWECVSVTESGMASPMEVELFKNAVWVIEKEKVLWMLDGVEKASVTYELDSTKTPKSIDLTLTLGPKGEMKRHIEGIYKLQDDNFTFCIPLGQEKPRRPTEFTAEKGTQQFMVVLKRKK